jgi:[acyl-carrier-protein] S-malonyltransferase
MIALLSPGQGAQTPGMFTPWLEHALARPLLEEWSAATGLDLVRLGTTAEADEIKDTAVAQPLIVAASLLGYELLRDRLPLPSDAIVAGHSVGELAAAAVAGVISPVDAIRLAAIRGAAMAKACALEPTGMAAVLGGDEPEVLNRLAQLGLTPANRNGANQIVAAGSVAAIDELVAGPPSKARVIVLKVAGAFHTEYMSSATAEFAAVAKEISVSDPEFTLLSNADGKSVTTGAEVIDRLVAQITKPVRWDLCQETLREVDQLIELPPAGTLVGLAKRHLRGMSTLAIKSLDSLAEIGDGVLA